MISKKHFNSEAYISIAGIKDDEGVVISRDQNHVTNYDWLNKTEDKWYLVSTNNDLFENEGCFNRCASVKNTIG